MRKYKSKYKKKEIYSYLLAQPYNIKLNKIDTRLPQAVTTLKICDKL